MVAMKDVAVVAYCRTGIAKAKRGALNQTHGIPLAAHVLRHAITRAGIEDDAIDDVVMACSFPEGFTGHNIARTSALWAGLGVAIPGVTINRFCCGGVSATAMAASRIASGECDAILVGGVESISLTQAHLNLTGLVYPPLQEKKPAVWWTMNQTADLVAKRYGYSREALDTYVVGSQQRVEAAREAGKFAQEIVPFTTEMQVTDKATGATQAQTVSLDHDEGPRPDTTLAGLSALKTIYANGTTTAGNASQFSDGAAALLLMDADLATRRGLPLLGLFRAAQHAGVEPEELSIAITPAVTQLMRRNRIDAADIDLWEIHEAYSVTVLYNQERLETPWDRTNVNGGAIAIGHPYAVSGVRYVGQTLMELGRRGARKAIIGVCGAGGQGVAAYLERI